MTDFCEWVDDDPQGIRGSALTGIAATARIILNQDQLAGSVPGGYVISGRATVYYLAVCPFCEGMVVPFRTEQARDDWAAGHPHPIAIGVEIREP
jgi:hypothetical protein